MNASQHMIAGMITTSATYLIAARALGEPATIEGLTIAAIIGIPTGLALDLIEPAVHPGHRGLAHSVVSLAGITKLANNTWGDATTASAAKLWTVVILAGVISHFALDATTKRSLPLLGL